MKRTLGASVGALSFLSACAATDVTVTELRGDALTGDFASISKALRTTRGRPQPDVRALPDASDDFYLAIKKSALAQRWFLSGHFKQFHPGGADTFSKVMLGTRVVSFEVQNDSLIIFDASERFQSSRVEDPFIILEAYPIVENGEFEKLSRSDQYILVDPSKGLNRFGVSAETFVDPYLSLSLPLQIGLSYLRNFRGLDDGAAFEQVFSGELEGDQGSQSVWGTLGITLRRYAEGEGYSPIAHPGIPFFLDSELRLVPDSRGAVTANPMSWNIHPGMEPIDVEIRGGAFRAQQDRPEADVLGALVRGVESWNDAFGFPVFRATLVDSDEVPEIDTVFMMVDYPGSGVGSAFADLDTNPNTGEIRGGTVYLTGEFFDDYDLFRDDPPAPAAASALESQPLATDLALEALTPTWGDVQARPIVCRYPAPFAEIPLEESEPLGVELTALEKGDRFLQHVVAHEFGHILGLNHNFKGSLLPPTSSIMDYMLGSGAVAQSTPGPYDIEAIRYLYGMTTTQPSQPFCSDADLTTDPTCAMFDASADPLRQYWGPFYLAFTNQMLQLGIAPDSREIYSLNELLAFARDSVVGGHVPPADRALAMRVAFVPARIPMNAADAANPAIVNFANTLAGVVLRRVVQEPIDHFGNVISPKITDPAVLATVSVRAGNILRNVDGVRPYSLRRTAVDTLRAVQDPSGLEELRSARAALSAALAGGMLPVAEVALAEDLLARIVSALDPYFD